MIRFIIALLYRKFVDVLYIPKDVEVALDIIPSACVGAGKIRGVYLQRNKWVRTELKTLKLHKYFGWFVDGDFNKFFVFWNKKEFKCAQDAEYLCYKQ